MEEKIIKNPFGFKNLGDGRVMVSLTINYYLIIGIIVFTIALAAIGAILYGLGLGIVALVKLLWSVKWWVLGSLLAILVAWLLSKILKGIKSSKKIPPGLAGGSSYAPIRLKY